MPTLIMDEDQSQGQDERDGMHKIPSFPFLNGHFYVLPQNSSSRSNSRGQLASPSSVSRNTSEKVLASAAAEESDEGEGSGIRI